MKTPELRHLLLEEPGPQGTPLFLSPTDLRKALLSVAGGKEISASQLCGVLKGDKSCPSGMANAIRAAVVGRLGDVTGRAEVVFIDRVTRALEHHNERRKALGGKELAPVTSAHLQAVATLQTPDIRYVEMLRRAETYLGFTLSQDTCELILRDHLASTQ